jgi:putative peptidoglycan lipid II flippase
MLLPQGVFAQAVATAAFPTLSAQVARGKLLEMRGMLAATLRAVLYLALPAAVGLVLLRTPLVELVFQRGAFTQESTQMVAGALALYALGLPAHSAVEILVRAFYAMHDTRTPVAIGVAAMALNIGLSVALMAAFGAIGRPQYSGLALANSLATTLEMGALLLVLRRRLGGLEGRRLASSLARVGLASAAMAAVLLAAGWVLAGASVWLRAGVGIAAGAAAYGGVSLALGATEPRAMIGAMRKRGDAGSQ